MQLFETVTDLLAIMIGALMIGLALLDAFKVVLLPRHQIALALGAFLLSK